METLDDNAGEEDVEVAADEWRQSLLADDDQGLQETDILVEEYFEDMQLARGQQS